MAGIRIFNSNLPHVFRYPDWTSGVFYPKGSVVAQEEVLNGQLRYELYVATKDVTSLLTKPGDNTSEWRALLEESIIDSDVLKLLSDSEYIQKLVKFDSEVIRLYQSIDSEDRLIKHQIAANDSDHVTIRHDFLSADSEIYREIDRVDSEISVLKDVDSDFRVNFFNITNRLDSDSLKIQAMQSQLDNFTNVALGGLDSEIQSRMAADSDFSVLVKQTIHNYLSKDSEIDSDTLTLKKRLDSDFGAAKRLYKTGAAEFGWGPQPYVTSTRYNIDEKQLTNHVLGHLWIEDTTNNKIYIVKDGVGLVTIDPAPLNATQVTDPATGEWTRGTQIEESPGDDADVNIYQNAAAPLPIVTNANLYTVLIRNIQPSVKVAQPDLEDAFRRTVNTILEIDSDLFYLIDKVIRIDSENDSEHFQFRHDKLALDSDIRVLRLRTDSDSRAIQELNIGLDSEERARRAADSDLRLENQRYFQDVDSDIILLRNNDSDQKVRLDSEEQARKDADSDILHGHTSVTIRYVKQTDYVARTSGGSIVDFTGAAVTGITDIAHGWVWNTHNQRLVVTDSDNNVIYNEVHTGEPIKVRVDSDTQFVRLLDTGNNAVIRDGGVGVANDDIFHYRKEDIAKTYNGGVLTPFFDSDVDLHDVDSDQSATWVWLAGHLARKDSEITDNFTGYQTVTPRFIHTTPITATLTLAAKEQVKFEADSDVATRITTFTGWVWNTHNSRLVIVDSDSEVIYNKVHLNHEPTKVSVGQIEYARTTDTGKNATIQDQGVLTAVEGNIWNYEVRRYSDSDNGGVLTPLVEEDRNLKNVDSENTKTLVWLIEEARRVVADLKTIHEAMDSEEHWRKAADSDLFELFYQPVEVITLANGTKDYNVTSSIFNEKRRWNFNSVVNSNGARTIGLENDDFEINHNRTNWIISVDGVNEVSFITITVAGSPTDSDNNVLVPWDDSETLTLQLTLTDTPASIALKLSELLLDKNVENTLDLLLNNVAYRATGRVNPAANFAIHGMTFTYFENTVPDPIYYYNDGDTITLEKPKEAPSGGTYVRGKP